MSLFYREIKQLDKFCRLPHSPRYRKLENMVLNMPELLGFNGFRDGSLDFENSFHTLCYNIFQCLEKEPVELV